MFLTSLEIECSLSFIVHACRKIKENREIRKSQSRGCIWLCNKATTDAWYISMLLLGKVASSRQRDPPPRIWKWQCIEDPPEIIFLFSKAWRKVAFARNHVNKPRACVRGSQASFSFSVGTAAYPHDFLLIERVMNYDEVASSILMNFSVSVLHCYLQIWQTI